MQVILSHWKLAISIIIGVWFILEIVPGFVLYTIYHTSPLG